MRWMGVVFWLGASVLGGSVHAEAATQDTVPAKTVEVYMPDGQLRNHPVRVYVPDRSITQEMNPELLLLRLSGLPNEPDTPLGSYSKKWPTIAVPNQRWEQNKGETTLDSTGTLLLVDLRSYPIPLYKTGVRIVPIVTWTESAPTGSSTNLSNSQMRAVSRRAIFLSNGPGTLVWTMIVLLVAFLIWYILMRRAKENAWIALCTPDGRMSVSLAQMAVWTVAVGGTVLAFGLMRLQVPEIPTTLVTLMGLSVATSGVGYIQADRLRGNPVKLAKETKKKATPAPSLSQLFTIKGPGDAEEEPDLAKAQLLFWTLITVLLFVFKSTAAGELWEVPQHMVALMGISQLGFLARKEALVQKKKKIEKGE